MLLPPCRRTAVSPRGRAAVSRSSRNRPYDGGGVAEQRQIQRSAKGRMSPDPTTNTAKTGHHRWSTVIFLFSSAWGRFRVWTGISMSDPDIYWIGYRMSFLGCFEHSVHGPMYVGMGLLIKKCRTPLDRMSPLLGNCWLYSPYRRAVVGFGVSAWRGTTTILSKASERL